MVTSLLILFLVTFLNLTRMATSMPFNYFRGDRVLELHPLHRGHTSRSGESEGGERSTEEGEGGGSGNT